MKLDKYALPTEEFLKQFKHKNVEFKIDPFEEMILRDIYQNDIETTKKLKRNVTPILKKWIIDKVDKKENCSLSAKGTTRGGKSLGMLGIADMIVEQYEDKEFDTMHIICGNQKEYRQKLSDAEFGDVYQIDENAFANVGLGSVTETLQLKDIQNIIAKKNIHTLYITPKLFLDNNAMLGLHAWGKDSKNWLTQFILYDLRSKIFPILGYVVIDVGKLFRKYGCYVYKELGGCTNPNKLKLEDLKSDTLKHTSCIPRNFEEKDLVNDGKSCPFYNLCSHGLCKYEHKKDSWIEKEMSGGLDERTQDRIETALKLFIQLAYTSEDGILKLDARDGKQLKLKVNLQIGSVSATKYTQTEVEEILVAIKSFSNLQFFKDTLEKLDKDWKLELAKIKDSQFILDNLPPEEPKSEEKSED